MLARAFEISKSSLTKLLSQNLNPVIIHIEAHTSTWGADEQTHTQSTTVYRVCACTLRNKNTWRMRMRGNYSSLYVCVCVCLCDTNLLTACKVHTIKMNMQASFTLVFEGFQLWDFCKMISFEIIIHSFLAVQVGHFRYIVND